MFNDKKKKGSREKIEITKILDTNGYLGTN